MEDDAPVASDHAYPAVAMKAAAVLPGPLEYATPGPRTPPPRRQPSSPEFRAIVLIALSVSTLLTGILLYGVGALRLGQWLRFIPYPVIGGFLAASGILLITGGMEVVTQTELSLSPASWVPFYSTLYGPQILIAALFALAIPLLGRFIPAYLALPVAFFAFLVLHARSQPTFIPIRDYDYFVDHSSTFVASAQQTRSATGQNANYG